MTPLVASLWITLIGMGLVFIALLLLWGLMEGIMVISARLPANKAEEDEAEGEEEAGVEPQALPVPAGAERKKRAAAAAVALALALRPTAVARPAQPQATGSAWQTVTRANQLNQSAQINRKSRGSVR